MKKNTIIVFFFFLSCYVQIFSQNPQRSIICRHGIYVHINQAASTYDTIFVNIPFAVSVIDVNVLIDTLIHTWDADMEFYLIHQSISDSLITHRGGPGDNFINTLLNDSAALSISQGTAPFTGSFRPERPLSVFNGTYPNGQWILKIIDNQGGDDGYLRAWCIQIVYTVSTGITQIIGEIPDQFFLFQNYPNPFNPNSKIKFSLAKLSNAKLVVYDILGREIQNLVNEELSPGVYEVDFEGTNLPSGVYYFSLRAGDFIETRKMVLIK